MNNNIKDMESYEKEIVGYVDKQLEMQKSIDDQIDVFEKKQDQIESV